MPTRDVQVDIGDPVARQLYRITGEPLMAAICHCAACRRANASRTVAWAMFQEAQVRFPRGSLTTYASSPEGKRGFCSVCGTQICFTADYIPGLTDITIGSSIALPRSRRRCVIGIANACPVFALPMNLLESPEYPRVA